MPDEQGCPPGQEFVVCANQCPQRCADLQQGIECQTNTECQPGCRCPEGMEAALLLITDKPVCVCMSILVTRLLRSMLSTFVCFFLPYPLVKESLQKYVILGSNPS